MVGSKPVFLSDTAVENLNSLHPGDQEMVRRVLDLLDNIRWRNNNKYDLFWYDHNTGLPAWAVSIGRTFVEFIETEDEVQVAHVAILSRFRPPVRPLWGPNS